MDLASISNFELLNRVEKLALSERKITHLILWHLVEIESRRLYIDLGFTSLYKYLTGHLRYSEDAAYRRIQAARLLKKLPNIEKSIEVGDLSLTQLTQVQKCLAKSAADGIVVTNEKAKDVLESIQRKSSYETQKILAIEFNHPIQDKEILKPQRNETVRMEITFSEEQMNELNQLKEMLSHVLPNPTWSELISYLVKSNIKKKLGKQVSNESVTSQSECIFTGASKNKSNNRKVVSIKNRRKLLAHANHQCEFEHNGEKCVSRYQLQVDHRMPLALGGTNDLANLRILCRTHNLSEARRMNISKF
ncbi:HNH endonuclease [Bdellovibrio sp. GT3]|uniref:HNH endonuclease n=1 Tax=Bdellovibrio sp. GT3 TaxID=3136282 RepID=UPI0030F31A4F